MRTKAFRRIQRKRHIKHRENIIRSYRTDNPPHKYDDKDLFNSMIVSKDREKSNEGNWIPYWYVHNRGVLNKGKIHCSCGICMAKTRNKGRRRIRGNYAPSINYKPSDLRKIQRMDLEEKEWLNF